MIKCARCGKRFNNVGRGSNSRKYCSKKCRAASCYVRRRIAITNWYTSRGVDTSRWLGKWKKRMNCIVCGQSFIPTTHRDRTCGDLCGQMLRRKINAHVFFEDVENFKVLNPDSTPFFESRLKTLEYKFNLTLERLKFRRDYENSKPEYAPRPKIVSIREPMRCRVCLQWGGESSGKFDRFGWIHFDCAQGKRDAKAGVVK